MDLKQAELRPEEQVTLKPHWQQSEDVHRSLQMVQGMGRARPHQEPLGR